MNGLGLVARGVLIGTLSAGSILATGCETAPSAGRVMDDGSDFRPAQPRSAETIFSPLDLPAPTDARLGSGAPGPGYWQQRADHAIEVDFDPEARRVEAVQTITYTNHSPHELGYLWLNLEQNLFRSDSAGARMTDPAARFASRGWSSEGFELGATTVDGRAHEIAVHDTLGRIDLDEPMMPGDTVRVRIPFAFDIPPYGADRLGIERVEQGEVFQLAQWFPSMCVYDDVHGWNTLPYLGAGEFYTNFGTYEVTIRAPREFVVVATGVLQNPGEVLTERQRSRLADALRTRETVMVLGPDEVGDPSSWPAGEGAREWRFRADDVRTFAWAASDAFIWDAASCASTAHGRCLVQSVYPKEGAELWAQSTDMLRESIEGYNARWVEYPYPTAINVNGIVGGMEYPMILFCRARTSEEALFGVTTHEIGHNWFPMVINTDERRHAWMDEGFCTFVNYYSQQERFGEAVRDRYRVTDLIRRMRMDRQQPIVTAPDRIVDGRLGFLAYGKPAHALIVLREQILGEERFDHAFRTYMRRWWFKSPRPADFFRSMEDAAGTDLAWFWRGWFLEATTLDQAVTRVREQDSTTEITFENRSDMVMPVLFEVMYEGGERERRRLPVQAWASSDRFTLAIDTNGRRITQVLVDPDQVFPDLDRGNNRWTR